MAYKPTIRKLGHRRVADHNAAGVIAARYEFDKERVVIEDDGTECCEPLTQIAYLLKLPGADRKLWLSERECQRVLEALQQVTPQEPPLPSDQQRLSTGTGKVGGDAW